MLQSLSIYPFAFIDVICEPSVRLLSASPSIIAPGQLLTYLLSIGQTVHDLAQSGVDLIVIQLNMGMFAVPLHLGMHVVCMVQSHIRSVLRVLFIVTLLLDWLSGGITNYLGLIQVFRPNMSPANIVHHLLYLEQSRVDERC